jgi:plastocyanin
MRNNCSRRWVRTVSDQAHRRSNRRLSVEAVLLTALLMVSSAESAALDRAVEGQTVRIVSMQFEPAELVVRPGTRIVWINDDLFPHTVTATNKAFDSGSLAASSSWTYVATQPGTYLYVCALHPTMKGRLTVQ